MKICYNLRQELYSSLICYEPLLSFGMQCSMQDFGDEK